MDLTEKDSIKCESNTPTNLLIEEKVISKRQLKKQKRAELYQLEKPERRKQERLKKKAKRAEKVSRHEDLGPSKKKLKLNTMQTSECHIRVAVDCSFDHFMTDRDITKLCQQLQYCYAKNRRASNPIQLFMTSIEGKTRSRLEEIGFYKSWDVFSKNESFSEVFGKEEVVYLSSESSNTLQTLSEDKVYVIGGLVDHNHHKGLCHKLAEERGFEHAQLPISDFLQLSSRNVLTVNHVFEVLLKFTETKVWKEAFFSAIPKRKIATNEENNDDDADNSEKEDNNVEDDPNDDDQNHDNNSDDSDNDKKETGKEKEDVVKVIDENTECNNDKCAAVDNSIRDDGSVNRTDCDVNIV